MADNAMQGPEQGPTALGALMGTEIAEQPEVWRRLLDEGTHDIDQAARVVRERPPKFVLFLARGSSDNAALYGKYLVEIQHGLPAGLVSPSTMTVYDARPVLDQVLVVAVSQSGSSPDLVLSLEVARRQGATTVAVTNDASSPLAQVAHAHIDIMAGPELAVAATKSYTAQLLALFLLLEGVRGGDGSRAAGMPALGDVVLDMEPLMAPVAERYRFAQRMVTTARGYSYATAKEASLKLMETSYVSAQAFSGADLLHGPLAMIDQQVPILAIAAEGAGGRACLPVVEQLERAGANLFCVGSTTAARDRPSLSLPVGVPEDLSPLLEVIPFQQLARRMAVARGLNPDAPRGLAKVTRTR